MLTPSHRRLNRIRVWIIRLALAEIFITWGYIAIVAQQVDPVVAAVLQAEITAVDKDLSGRVRVLESDMTEVKWLTRAVTGAMIGVFIVAGLDRKDRKRV